ncbi:short-chain dehydrogenase [bacterium SCGC AG-212-C10]|nr:short-chain dehydrogenase [bacterium SCGC AG-212-C10]
MDDFTGKTAVITGGASGIGFATAKAFAREGMNIVIADIEDGPMARAVAEIEALGVQALGVKTDVGKLSDVEHLADATWERFGGAHIIFNNAGVAIAGPIQEMSHKDWEWVLQVDLWGPIHGVEVFVPRMIAQNQGGHVINTASFAGLVANDGLGVYCVAKYGVVALSECLYRDISREGIGVSVLCPMQVQTNINRSERNRPPELGGPEERPLEVEENPMQPVGSVINTDDVAAKVVQAVRDRQLYIHPHPEARGFVRARFNRIDRAFGPE